jgi:acyl-phosphate glycerol 3-phosphate acyltransferase
MSVIGMNRTPLVHHGIDANDPQRTSSLGENFCKFQFSSVARRSYGRPLIAALFGHSRSIWLNFTGGKSAATGLGVLLAMSWPVGLGAATVFGIVLAIARIVSLSSIFAALTAIALVCGFEQPLPYRLLVIGGGIYVIVRHRANIQRLIVGTEPRLGRSGPDYESRSASLAHVFSGVSISRMRRLWHF